MVSMISFSIAASFNASANSTYFLQHLVSLETRKPPPSRVARDSISCGLNLARAKEQFGSVRVFRYSYKNSSMALVCGRTDGQVKLLADAESGKIYGALWIGPHATDMIAEIALAMRNGLTLEHIAGTIHPHPTFQEAAASIAAAWSAQAIRKRT